MAARKKSSKSEPRIVTLSDCAKVVGSQVEQCIVKHIATLRESFDADEMVKLNFKVHIDKEGPLVQCDTWMNFEQRIVKTEHAGGPVVKDEEPSLL